MFIAFTLYGIEFLCCKIVERKIVEVGLITLLAELLSGTFFTLYESFAWETFASLVLFAWLVLIHSHVLRAYCNFESKRAISITLFGRGPNKKTYVNIRELKQQRF